MEALYQHLFENGMLSLREILRLVLLSALFTAVCVKALPHNAPSRRLLLLSALVALSVLPWMLSWLDAVWSVRLQDLPAFSLSASVPNVLLWVWVAVACVLSLSHLGQVRREIRRIADLPLLEHPRIAAHLDRLTALLPVKTPRVHLGNCACSTTIGRPRITLPAHWEQWDENTLHSVLAHELTHITRRDDRWLLLTRLLVLIYWWMPWLVFLYRHHLRVMEESCDDAASQLVGHELQYASALAVAASGHPSPEVDKFVNVTAMHEHHLVGRVGRFAHHRALEPDTSAVYWWVAGVLSAVVIVTSFEPRLVAQQPTLTGIKYASMAPAESKTQALFPVVHTSFIDWDRLPQATLERLKNPQYTADAVYPGSAIRNLQEADVTIEFNLAADGSVNNVRVAAGHEAPPAFAESAMRAVHNTRYRPWSASAEGDMATDTIRRALLTRNRTDEPQQTPVRVGKQFSFRLEYR